MTNLTQYVVHNKHFLQHRYHFSVSVIVGTVLVVGWFALTSGLTDPATIEHWLYREEHLFLILAISFLLMLLCAITPLPAEAVTIANGVIFGPIAGTVVTWLSAMLGACVTFLWSRHFVNSLDLNFLEKEKYQAINRWMEKWGLFGFLLARLIPIVPFFTLNIGAALLPVSTKNYLLVTGIAILPHILLICFLSDHFTQH